MIGRRDETALTGGWERDEKGVRKGWEEGEKGMRNGWEQDEKRVRKGWEKGEKRVRKGWEKGWEKGEKRMRTGWERDENRVRKGWERDEKRVRKGWEEDEKGMHWDAIPCSWCPRWRRGSRSSREPRRTSGRHWDRRRGREGGGIERAQKTRVDINNEDCSRPGGRSFQITCEFCGPSWCHEA